MHTVKKLNIWQTNQKELRINVVYPCRIPRWQRK